MTPSATSVFRRDPRKTLPTAVGGDGMTLIDSDGKRYLNARGGAAVSCLGHGHPRVLNAICKQVRALAYAHTSFFTTDAAEELAACLAAAVPGDLDHVYFVSGGSGAIEAALKLARQYFVEIGRPQRQYLIARRQSYHGNTLGTLAIGGNVWRRRPFLPLLVPAHHVSPCYAYHKHLGDESNAQYVQRLTDELDAKIVELNTENIAAFVAEAVVGVTAGTVPPVGDYFRRIRTVCNHHGVLLLFDEVMSGMGRIGYLFVCEEDGVVPDMAAIAKGLGDGYQPIGVTLVNRRIVDAIAKGSGFFQHDHTYIGHATACVAALEVQKVIEEENLFANVQARGEQLRAVLHVRFADHVHVDGVRGHGLFVGMELVADHATKVPLAPACKTHARMKAEAMQRGLMAYPMGGTIDGRRGDHILLAPPFIATAQDIDAIVECLGDAVDAAATKALEAAW